MTLNMNSKVMLPQKKALKAGHRLLGKSNGHDGAEGRHLSRPLDTEPDDFDEPLEKADCQLPTANCQVPSANCLVELC